MSTVGCPSSWNLVHLLVGPFFIIDTRIESKDSFCFVWRLVEEKKIDEELIIEIKHVILWKKTFYFCFCHNRLQHLCSWECLVSYFRMHRSSQLWLPITKVYFVSELRLILWNFAIIVLCFFHLLVFSKKQQTRVRNLIKKKFLNRSASNLFCPENDFRQRHSILRTYEMNRTSWGISWVA